MKYTLSNNLSCFVFNADSDEEAASMAEDVLNRKGGKGVWRVMSADKVVINFYAENEG